MNSWVKHIWWILITCYYHPSEGSDCLVFRQAFQWMPLGWGFPCSPSSSWAAAPSALLAQMLIPHKSSCILGDSGVILSPSFVRNMSTGFGFSPLVSLSVLPLSVLPVKASSIQLVGFIVCFLFGHVPKMLHIFPTVRFPSSTGSVCRR